MFKVVKKQNVLASKFALNFTQINTPNKTVKVNGKYLMIA